jgi:hypothetical protein
MNEKGEYPQRRFSRSSSVSAEIRWSFRRITGALRSGSGLQASRRTCRAPQDLLCDHDGALAVRRWGRKVLLLRGAVPRPRFVAPHTLVVLPDSRAHYRDALLPLDHDLFLGAVARAVPPEFGCGLLAGDDAEAVLELLLLPPDVVNLALGPAVGALG